MAKVIVLGSNADSLIVFRGMLLKEIVARGHNVFACAPNASEYIKNELSRIGAKYVNVKLDRTGLNPFLDVKSINSLVRLFKEIQPDIFLGYTIKPVIYGSLASRIARVPMIFSMITGVGYAYSGTGIKSNLIRVIASFLYKYALSYNHKVFFQNPDNLNLFARLGLVNKYHQTVQIHGSGVDTEYFLPASYPERTTFLLMARLIYSKGIKEYFDAAKIIKQKYPEVKFKLVGWLDESNPDSITRNELDNWLASGCIEYLGKLSDVRNVLADSSVYVLPTFYPEGIPRSILEALAMARPIITTDTPGCRETVKQGRNGLLIPVRNVSSLVSAMEYFIADPRRIREMGKCSRKLAVEKYEVRKVNEIILTSMGLQ